MRSPAVRRRGVAALMACVFANGCSAPEPGSPAEALDRKEQGEHRFCAWLHGSTEDPAFTELAYDTFAAHAGALDAVHPVWWRVDGPTRIVNHPAGQEAPYAGFHDPRVLAHTTPGGGRTKLMPMIGASQPSDSVHVHHMINDPVLRARHVRAVVEIAVENGYDGVDIDYEHIDPGHLKGEMTPGQTWATERLAYSTFVAELAAALHAADKSLSLAVPLDDSPESVFDDAALAASADEIHLMGYDYHYDEGDHAGPVAPLGWVERGVAFIRALDGGRQRARFLLGLPNYGLAGPEAPAPGRARAVTECPTSQRCAALAGNRYALTTDHLTRCSLAGDDAVDPGRTPNAALPSGDHLFFEDLASLE